ncbi:MAG TPA: HD domain-containing protein [Phycisphaerales bacterium]|nr:HD domain-containing protein [Phycisphaerales bacterium]HIB51168.1 HD domain-containing protein [Phycisphaerales bacterium]HIN83603.1 HD domain-containing protein [Phycisphaerales bacterium]HIO20482.1 HD domain-containing protein [Phycisphaerales bacterium]HIO53030.1 HD domain-containing protein [Phycisphaerales bacterium]
MKTLLDYGLICEADMTNLPQINVSTKQTLSLAQENELLRRQLQAEKEGRLEAETALLMIDLAQENGDPPPSRMAMIVGLAKLAESRDDDTGTHLIRIKHYTSIIANAYATANPKHLPRGEVSIISAASMLHDIGKVGIADKILLHPGTFCEKQFNEMKRHTIVGGDILLALSEELGSDPWIDTSIQIALSHHEKWDGSGYPFGLKNEGINLPARIVAVADVYDALTSQRVYKKEMSHEEAVSIIQQNSGSHFDPKVVEAFVSKIDAISEAKKRLVS